MTHIDEFSWRSFGTTRKLNEYNIYLLLILYITKNTIVNTNLWVLNI